ncbi:hypothetical protein MNEG_6554 [Monoraphidium neglectum]|uniref:GAF domain-containing protein n=1 Tax=Monoraphidium neglectum TaxID=145388 RepID=A0A0D2L2A4_9CHLO|nr:hypothetical protein MNEG_6554 [Monoraphidium neglectum]KIZ01404.1 hypothetical protein MNEG_6554 [Monoraphidium neglectum]|eukprot:XP_013900423.1 hypothetical protein MNEG_6554 [Monoraphidium neglectum]
MLQLHLVGSCTPALALAELAELIVGQLPEVDLCSISAAVRTPGGGPRGAASAVLLAASGVGEGVCRAFPVVARGADWSALRVFAEGCALRFDAEPTTTGDAAPQLPHDLATLRRRAGLRSFLLVPITAGPRLLGCLTVASLEPGAFGAGWWLPVLGLAATALLTHVCNPQFARLCRVMAAVEEEPDTTAAAGLAMQARGAARRSGLSDYLQAATNVRMAVRLGLLDGDSLVIVEKDDTHPHPATYEPPAALSAGTHGGGDGDGDGGGGAAAQPRRAPLAATALPLAGTLLSFALKSGKARFVSDTTQYFQQRKKQTAHVHTTHTCHAIRNTHMSQS